MAPSGPGPAAVLTSQRALIAVAAGVIFARLYLRLRIQHRSLLVSDLLMCFAWLAAVATAAFDIKFAQLGALEPHVMTNLDGFEGSMDEVSLNLKMFWASSIPFFTTFYLCKAALLSVFLQVFPAFMRRRRILLWLVIGYVGAAYVVSLSMVFFFCLPVERNWSLDPKTTCPASSVERVFQVAWALHFTGDLMIFLLPWLVVTKLQMKKKMKIGIYCTFLLGIINIVFCVVRFITVQSSVVNSRAALSLVDLWSSLDANIGLVIACLPSLRPYFRGKGSMGYYHSSSAQQHRGTGPGPSIRP